MDDKAHAEIVTKLRRERDEAIAEIGRIGAELGRCRAEVERLHTLMASMQDWPAEIDAMVAELREQCDEIERLREDAERYRWLREKCKAYPAYPELRLTIARDDGWRLLPWSGDDPDRKIDALRGEEE